jgi:hypothetical protein
MKILGYVAIVGGVLYAAGSFVGNAPQKIAFSALIAGIGVLLSAAARKSPTNALR